MSTRRRMDKQTGAYPCSGPQVKEETAAPHDNMDEFSQRSHRKKSKETGSERRDRERETEGDTERQTEIGRKGEE